MVDVGYNTDSSEARAEKEPKYWSLKRKKDAYLDYLASKREEIDEQQDARRFVHGAHWTQEEITQLKARKQPAVYENITARKVRGIVGTLERLKQDPKAYPRTPKHEKGAELATAVVNYAMDAQNWSAKDPLCSEMVAIEGIGGLEFNLIQGDQGDPEIEIDVIEVDNFFYDPRSVRHDFSDARYMGVGKWMDLEEAIDLFPDSEEELRNAPESDSELTTDSDRENKWFDMQMETDKRLRIVEIWYKHEGGWCWGVFTGDTNLMEGKSWLKDEKGKPACKYEMFSAYVDQEGDRYGIVRDLKPLNRELNMRRSKALYTMLSRRIIAANGAFDDIELARREAARADGVVVYNPTGENPPTFDDQARQAETQAQFQFYESLRTSIENFGPNVAILGQGLENSSGRAINMLQQAGMADLGPFIQSYRGWKIRVYRKMWNAVQQHWTSERWIRVTDDDDISQFIQINGVDVDPMTGQPTLVNALGNLDVDIILDEGPDEVNAMGDAYDTLTVLAKNSGIPPDMIKPWFTMLLELAPLPGSLKKRLLEKLNPEPTPEDQAKKQLEMRHAVAETAQIESDSTLKMAQANKANADAAVAGMDQGGNMTVEQPEDPNKIMTEALEKLMSAKLKSAQADKVRQDIQLEPQKMAMEQQANAAKVETDRAKMQVDAQNKAADRQANMQSQAADRQVQVQSENADRKMQASQADRQFKQAAKDSDRNHQVNMKKASQKPAAPKGNK